TGKFARKMSADVGRSAEDRRPVFWPAGQFLTRHTRRVRSYIALCAILACGSACGGSNTGSTSNPANRPERGVVDRSALRRGGKKLLVTAIDPRTVAIAFPSPFAPGLRLLDNFPILPKHVLEPALKAGAFNKAWGPATPVAQLVGLGPFVLKQYASGQRMMFE